MPEACENWFSLDYYIYNFYQFKQRNQNYVPYYNRFFIKTHYIDWNLYVFHIQRVCLTTKESVEYDLYYCPMLL